MKKIQITEVENGYTIEEMAGESVLDTLKIYIATSGVEALSLVSQLLGITLADVLPAEAPAASELDTSKTASEVVDDEKAAKKEAAAAKRKEAAAKKKAEKAAEAKEPEADSEEPAPKASTIKPAPANLDNPDQKVWIEQLDRSIEEGTCASNDVSVCLRLHAAVHTLEVTKAKLASGGYEKPSDVPDDKAAHLIKAFMADIIVPIIPSPDDDEADF